MIHQFNFLSVSKFGISISAEIKKKFKLEIIHITCDTLHLYLAFQFKAILIWILIWHHRFDLKIYSWKCCSFWVNAPTKLKLKLEPFDNQYWIIRVKFTFFYFFDFVEKIIWNVNWKDTMTTDLDHVAFSEHYSSMSLKGLST